MKTSELIIIALLVYLIVKSEQAKRQKPVESNQLGQTAQTNGLIGNV